MTEGVDKMKKVWSCMTDMSVTDRGLIQTIPCRGERYHEMTSGENIKYMISTQEEQLNQAACLNLVVNAITVWNTVYMQAALDQLKSEGYEISEDDVKHLSPARSEHINMYGKYYFNIEEGLKRNGLRELRKPSSDVPL